MTKGAQTENRAFESLSSEAHPRAGSSSLYLSKAPGYKPIVFYSLYCCDFQHLKRHRANPHPYLFLV